MSPNLSRLSRRGFVRGSAAVSLTALGLTPDALAQTPDVPGPRLGRPEPFSFDRLTDRAARMARAPYVPLRPRKDEALDPVDYDAHRQLRYRHDKALWIDGSAPFPVELFHMNQLYRKPVRVHAVEGETAREVLYDPANFNYGSTGLRGKLPPDLGYAGLRLMDPTPGPLGWLSFIGASYFRSRGEEGEFGISARGIAVNSTLVGREEFPEFTAFWVEKTPPESGRAVIHALLDGESITGAYRFVCAYPGRAVMEVEARLFPRKPIEQLGIAALTSMFWYGEDDRRRAADWRPEIHDSDGLSFWSGGGERLWRPLSNPPKDMAVTVFPDANPRGFGFLQRDRAYDHYLDDNASYHRRPSLWIEPLDPWGPGRMVLMEIPTRIEIYDNMVGFWQSDRPARPDDPMTFRYRVLWTAGEPRPARLARVLRTRTGQGALPAEVDDGERRKFVVDFAGGPLDGLVVADEAPRCRLFGGAAPGGSGEVKAVIRVGRGEVMNACVMRIDGRSGEWRAGFDLAGVQGDEAVELRCHLERFGQRLTETWVYAYHPDRRPS